MKAFIAGKYPSDVQFGKFGVLGRCVGMHSLRNAGRPSHRVAGPSPLLHGVGEEGKTQT